MLINGIVVAFTLGSFILICSTACTKEKVPLPPEPVEPTKWEKIAGNYKVYDTLGNFLYEMNIAHIFSSELNVDSLYFQNMDGNFSFGEQQPYFGFPDLNFFRFGYHELLSDSLNNRWKMIEVGDLPYNNYYDDTIRLKFRLTNINYYLEDLTPYKDTIKFQIAVKQH